MYEISVESHFSAAHKLLHYEGNCERLHGHNWKVRITFQSLVLDACGMAIDFKVARRILSDAIRIFDHAYLNDMPQFETANPSCENIARMIHDTAAEALRAEAGLEGVTVKRVQVWESPGSSVTYYLEKENG